jgi:hypothetical protein
MHVRLDGQVVRATAGLLDILRHEHARPRARRPCSPRARLCAGNLEFGQEEPSGGWWSGAKSKRVGTWAHNDFAGTVFGAITEDYKAGDLREQGRWEWKQSWL